MKRWRRLSLFLLLAFIGATLVVPPARLCVWGWLRGEPCYRGKPVSYWRHEMGGWMLSSNGGLESQRYAVSQVTEFQPEPVVVTSTGGIHHMPICFYCWFRHDTVLEKLQVAVLGETPWDSADGNCALPDLASGDPDAAGVLLELLNDDDPRIREMAAIALAEGAPPGDAVIARLRNATKDSDASVALAAKSALARVDSYGFGQ